MKKKQLIISVGREFGSGGTAGLITMAFLTMNPVIIIAVVAIYFVLYVLFRKNKSSVREYIEKIALGDKYYSFSMIVIADLPLIL